MLPYYWDLLPCLTDSSHLSFWNSDTLFHTHQCSAAMVALEQHRSLQPLFLLLLQRKKNPTKIQSRSIWISNPKFSLLFADWACGYANPSRYVFTVTRAHSTWNHFTWKSVGLSWPFPVAAVAQGTVDVNAFTCCQSASKISQPPQVFLLNSSLLLKWFPTLSLCFLEGIPDKYLSYTSFSGSEPFTSLWSWFLLVQNLSHIFVPNCSCVSFVFHPSSFTPQ